MLCFPHSQTRYVGVSAKSLQADFDAFTKLKGHWHTSPTSRAKLVRVSNHTCEYAKERYAGTQDNIEMKCQIQPHPNTSRCTLIWSLRD